MQVQFIIYYILLVSFQSQTRIIIYDCGNEGRSDVERPREREFPEIRAMSIYNNKNIKYIGIYIIAVHVQYII